MPTLAPLVRIAAVLTLLGTATLMASPREEAAKSQGEGPEVLENSIGMKLVLVPGGEFWMGSAEKDDDGWDNERPRHRVRISHPFYLGRHEVTIGDFRRFVEATGYQTESERTGERGYGWDAAQGRFASGPQFNWSNATGGADDLPVVNVTWADGVAFCQWLSDKEGALYRLPTEAEWEYACRAGSDTRFSTGDERDGVRLAANVADASLRALAPQARQAEAWDDGHPFSAPVGSFQANAYGLFDMHGNVQEWCADWYGYEYYEEFADETAVDPTGPPEGEREKEKRVARGGTWSFEALANRCANRSQEYPDSIMHTLGFRVLREAE